MPSVETGPFAPPPSIAELIANNKSPMEIYQGGAWFEPGRFGTELTLENVGPRSYQNVLAAGGTPELAQQVSDIGQWSVANRAKDESFFGGMTSGLKDFVTGDAGKFALAALGLYGGVAGLGEMFGGAADLAGYDALMGGGGGGGGSVLDVFGSTAGAPGWSPGAFGGESMGGLTSLAANIAPGEIGGIPQEILKKLGINMGGPWSTGFNIFSGLYGLNQSRKIQNAAMAPPQVLDPFGYGPRAPYAAELAGLRADPSQIQKIPGYQAGLDTVTRKMAAQGYLGSGNMMAALQEYGGQFYDRELARLSQLAGAQFQPQGFRTDTQGLAAGADLASKALASMGYAVRGMEQPGGFLS